MVPVRHLLIAVLLLWNAVDCALAQQAGRRASGRARPAATNPIVLKPSRVWDGLSAETHAGWVVVVRGQTIEAAGPSSEVKVPESARTIELNGATLIPGLIDAHTHVLLHPYDEALWNDQVLKEALALRVCRATNHLRRHAAFRFYDNSRSGD